MLDLDTPAGRDRLEPLLAGAAAFISNQPLARRRALGLDLDAVVGRHPQLVAVAVTPFGDLGPYSDMPGCSLTSAALGAASWVIGEPDRPPLTLPFDLADYEGGANAAAAALAGVFAALRGGQGQGVDISIAELIASFTGINARMYLPYGKRWARAGRKASESGGSYPYTIFPCSDGYIAMIGRGQKDWDSIVAAMGSPAWAQEDRFRDPYRIARESADDADVHLGSWMATRTRAELLAVAREHGFALAPVQLDRGDAGRAAVRAPRAVRRPARRRRPRLHPRRPLLRALRLAEDGRDRPGPAAGRAHRRCPRRGRRGSGAGS